MEDLRILLADDHPVIIFSLKLVLKELEFGNYKVDEAFCGEEVLHFCKKNEYDLVIIDMNMPDTDFFRLIENVLLFRPGLRVLVYTSNSELLFAGRLLSLGISGFVSKLAGVSQIKTAIRDVLNNKTYVSEQARERIFKDLRSGVNGKENPFLLLSARELQVAQFLYSGFSNEDIKKHLSVHTSSVSTYKVRIFEKLNISHLSELVELGTAYNLDKVVLK